MTETTPYSIPKEPGRWRAVALAIFVHALLLAFLWIGIRWQNETPVAIEAEIWSPQIREAAPPPAPALAQSEPEAKPEPVPAHSSSVQPKQAEPTETEPVVKPDIALEREKKAKQKRVEEEKIEKAKLEKAKLEKAKAETEKLDEEKKKREKKEQEKREQEKKEQERKESAAKKRKQEAAEAKALAQAREEEMRRIASSVGSAGDAAQSQGSRDDASYMLKISARIRRNTNFTAPNNVSENQHVEYEVKLLPDGSVAGIRKLKSSGIPRFDEAVERAIEKSQPYPADRSGAVPKSFVLSHKPKD